MEDSKIVIGQKYKASAGYVPSHGDEISLVAGQTIAILFVYDDGWVLGKNESSGETGLLPGNFLAPIGAPESTAQRTVEKIADKRKSSMMPLSTATGTKSTPGAASAKIDGSGAQQQQQQAPKQQQSPQQQQPQQQQQKQPQQQQQPQPAKKQQIAGPHTVATFSVADFPSGASAGAPRSSHPGAPKFEHNGSEQLDAPRKLAELAVRNSAGPKVPSNIGSLRILVAGDSGIGKSALIRSFVRASEVVESTQPKVVETFSALPILQTAASTIPAHHLRLGEDKLNLSLLEPPGFGSHTDAMRVIRPTVDFHTRQFQDTDRVFHRDASIPAATLLRFLSSGTGAHTHVDVCLYAILHRIKAVDLEYMRLLSPGCVLVPVIVKSDTMTAREAFTLKATVLEELWRAGIDIYGFGLSPAELMQLARQGTPGAVPFAVSDAAALDRDRPALLEDVLDEFEALKDHVFYRANELRQQTAEKFVLWRSAHVNP
ncbi:hypothetical protein HDU87_005266 [Geranomyces variabilis]|uniref:SH3 domain-containing protein n=1 Tax=Geranomyces variabilis TaxID=109894 RepID=A0AAD5XLW9_9FUNG|nr:hypothetical protein HDU87_005266 [Geranomyces variabilis]